MLSDNMLNAFMLSVVNKPFMLSIILLNAFMLSVVAPKTLGLDKRASFLLVRISLTHITYTRVKKYDVENSNIDSKTQRYARPV